jgi:hypothetical protein
LRHDFGGHKITYDIGWQRSDQPSERLLGDFAAASSREIAGKPQGLSRRKAGFFNSPEALSNLVW